MPSNVFVRRRLQVSAIQGSFWPRNFRELLGTESQRHVVPTWHVSRAVLYRRLEVLDSRAAVQPWAHELPKWLQFKCLWNCQSANLPPNMPPQIYQKSKVSESGNFLEWSQWPKWFKRRQSHSCSLSAHTSEVSPLTNPVRREMLDHFGENVKLSSVKNTGVSSPCSHWSHHISVYNKAMYVYMYINLYIYM